MTPCPLGGCAVATGVATTLLFLIATWQWGATGLSAAYALSLPIAASYGLLFVFKANLLFPKEESALTEERRPPSGQRPPSARR